MVFCDAGVTSEGPTKGRRRAQKISSVRAATLFATPWWRPAFSHSTWPRQRGIALLSFRSLLSHCSLATLPPSPPTSVPSRTPQQGRAGGVKPGSIRKKNGPRRQERLLRLPEIFPAIGCQFFRGSVLRWLPRPKHKALSCRRNTKAPAWRLAQ